MVANALHSVELDFHKQFVLSRDIHSTSPSAFFRKGVLIPDKHFQGAEVVVGAAVVVVSASVVVDVVVGAAVVVVFVVGLA